MSDQPVTPDREARGPEVLAEADRVQQNIEAELFRAKLLDIVDEALRRDCQSKPCMDVVHKADAIRAVDALLPLLTEALDRARQQGREQVEAIFDDMWAHPDWEGQVSMGFASTFAQEVHSLARGADRKDEG